MSSLLDQAVGNALLLPVQIPEGDATLALLTRIAAAVEDTGKKSEEASEKTASGFARAQEGIRNAADTFNEVREAVTNLLGDIVALAEGMAAGADEAFALEDRARELGVDFDEAAESAGRFLDETAAMGAANQLAARGIRLSQEELNALTRVAGTTSQALRITTEEGVTRLTDALISGRGRALAPFGAELSAVAGNTHTVEQRLAALVSQAGNVEPAVDTATDSINRFKDSIEDMQRSFSAGFVEGLRRMDEVAAATRTADDDVGDLNESVRALGGFVAETLSKAANGFKAVLAFLGLGVQTVLNSVGALGAALEAVARGNFRGAGGAASAYFSNAMTQGAAADLFASLRSSVAALNAQDEAGGGRGGLGAGASAPGGPSAADAARDAAARRTRGAVGGTGGGGGTHHPQGADMTFSQDEATYGAEGLRLRREAVERAAQLRERAAMDELIAAERTRQQRQVGSTLADRLDQQREQRNLSRTQRNLQQRLDMEVSYSERMEEMHHERVNAAQLEAEGVTMAFNALGGAMAKHIQLAVLGKETIGAALQGILADTLTSIGQEAIVKGAMEIATGLSMLAGIATAPLAPLHFAAGAAFIGVGALAVAGGAALTPAPPAPAGASGGGGAGRAANVSKGDGMGGSGGTTVNVMFGGPQYGTGGTRQAAREIAGVLNRGAIQGGVRLNLQGSGGAV